uniref:Uncharacterized protein n=1 Tax=Parascaris equorum TaxID=6256 RepID=A0A914RC98_PAREQ
MIDPSISSSPLLPPPLNATSLARIGPPTTANEIIKIEDESFDFVNKRDEVMNYDEGQEKNYFQPLKMRPLSEFDYAPDIHSQILANSLAVQERQLAATAVRF